ncbi:MAG: signal transduction histidine kinase [Mycobacterium sp.]|nr:signal transduction histidine kinase [Mycobacterium sp.]
MSSNPHADRARADWSGTTREADPDPKPGLLSRIRSPRSWSLRARLLVTQVALLAIVCAGIGVATEFALQRFLTNQLDEQLVEAGRRSVAIFDLGPPPQAPGYPHRRRLDSSIGPGPAFLDAPGQSTRTVGAVVHGGQTVDAGVITADGSPAAISPAAAAQLARIPPNGKRFTVDLDGLGRYRVIALPSRGQRTGEHPGGPAERTGGPPDGAGMQTGPGGQVIVTGLPMSVVDETLIGVVAMFSVVAAIALVAATTAGIVIIRRQLAPLSRVAAAASAVANLELDRGEVRLPTRIVAVEPASARTEVGQLGSALNRMLDRIAGALSARQASETRVRQFVADASHELRTPLAAIQGYTELAQRNRDEVPAEVAHAMGRVESESRRMTRLVEDMLLLARLDDGRPLERETVDLSRLAVDAVSDAHIAGPDHNWSLDLPDQPVVVVGDDARLHQVLGNLLANSRTHTPAGTSVTTSLVVDDAGGAVLTVADDGPGIPADQQPEIFGRFVRGDSSRSRRGGSTGLGLAIVAAVVKAHDGTITVDSGAGQTEFTVRIPGAQENHSANKNDA